MKKIPYYIKNEFNGIASTFTPAEAVTFSKSTFPRVVRVPVDEGFRYFLRGIEIQREEIFLTGGEKGLKPAVKLSATYAPELDDGVPQISKRNPNPVFTWRTARNGKLLKWVKRKSQRDTFCMLTGLTIAGATCSYTPISGGPGIRNVWRVSMIPRDAELI